MGRTRTPDTFGFKSFKANAAPPAPRTVSGSDNAAQLLRPLPFKRRFRPPFNIKASSIQSSYDYASLWVRWRRGYELAMYSQQAYDGYTYSFKYFVSGTPGVGAFLPGIVFNYPTTRADARTWIVGIRPRDSFNFTNVGLSVAAVTDFDADTYAVTLSSTFGAPISYFQGEVLSDRFNADGTEKEFGYNNYTVTAVGVGGVPTTPSDAPIFDTLFLSHTQQNSWTVVDATKLAVPATGPPAIGDFLATEMRAQCTCPDFLAREGVNLWDESIYRRYPFTRVQNLDPGFYDAGVDAPAGERRVPANDDPGFARTFGFIYLNEIYNIPRSTESTYSDPNLYYFQPRWCKHIYAAMWDLQLRFKQTNTAEMWLVQPNDEPMNEYYREMFQRKLVKQTDFFNRERNLEWWLRYGPVGAERSQDLVRQDTYNYISKVLNFGDINSLTEVEAPNFVLYTLEEYNPFAPFIPADAQIYDGGTYKDGELVDQPVNKLDGGEYLDAELVPYPAFPSLINGGTY